MILDCIVFGRKTESVPANRIKNIVALKSALSCYRIKCCVRTRMSYVKSLSRRIRELNKRVKLFLFAFFIGVENALFFPYFLPLGLY